MRERAAAVGGTLQAGPRPGGGFRVARPAAPLAGTVDGRRPASRSRARAAVIRVLLADDQALIRAGFRVLLDAADDIEVVGEAGDGAQAVDAGPPSSAPTWC